MPRSAEVVIRSGVFSYGFKRVKHSRVFRGICDQTNKEAIIDVPEGSSISAAMMSIMHQLGDIQSMQECAFRAGYLVGRWDERYAESEGIT